MFVVRSDHSSDSDTVGMDMVTVGAPVPELSCVHSVDIATDRVDDITGGVGEPSVR